ncbi:hypothetical protein ACFW0I_32685 [[Kitasatospora] papulosa]|uniref:hypothetical protein n=1 Tax=[Kitasatospora] papulosa TaxID=1464011 RepID=UPI0036CCED3F
MAYFLSLEEAIERGIVARTRCWWSRCRTPALNSALRTAGDGSEEVRGKRLGALQAATLKVSAKEELRRVLSCHQPPFAEIGYFGTQHADVMKLHH